MKRTLIALLLGCSFYSSAQTGYITESKKRITYKVSEGKIYYSTGKVALPSIASTDFKKAYATASVPVVVIPPVVTPPIVNPPVSVPVAYTIVGTGSGNLDLGDISGKHIKIKPGSYGMVTISKATKASLDGSGVSLEKLYLTEGNVFEMFGFAFHDQKYRPIEIEKLTQSLYLHDISFTNTGDYSIAYYYQGIWDGTDATATGNWTLDKLTFDNTGVAFTSNGGFDSKGIKNLMLNFTFSNSTIKNCPWIGAAIYLGAAQNYALFGNTISNVNTLVNNHNGIFHLVGNGSIHDNFIQHHQGNMVRAWGVSYGREIKEILIYNNKVYDSRKYSAFELQATPEIQEYLVTYPTRIAMTNARVYNNTVGRMNTSKDWEGLILDLYNTGGTLRFDKNLGFDLYTDGNDGKITTMINNMSDTPVISNSGNQYYNTQKEAVLDTQNFKSTITGVGAQ